MQRQGRAGAVRCPHQATSPSSFLARLVPAVPAAVEARLCRKPGRRGLPTRKAQPTTRGLPSAPTPCAEPPLNGLGPLAETERRTNHARINCLSGSLRCHGATRWTSPQIRKAGGKRGETWGRNQPHPLLIDGKITPARYFRPPDRTRFTIVLTYPGARSIARLPPRPRRVSHAVARIGAGLRGGAIFLPPR